MLPHSSLLILPPTQKSRRRTFHFGSYNGRLRTSADELFIRELTIDQVGLGCAVWDGAIVLARFIYANRVLFQSKSVLELGSGIGLPGLMAARYASTVYLTDYIQELLDNIDYNAKLNSNVEEEEFSSADSAAAAEFARQSALKRNLSSSAKSRFIDWHKIPELENWKAKYAFDEEIADEKTTAEQTNEQQQNDSASGPSIYDPLGCGSERLEFVIGSEIMYTRSSHHRYSLARTINYYLRPGGEFICVQSANREGMELFIELISGQYNYQVKIEKLTESSGLIGNYQLGAKQPKQNGFVQREEDYYLYRLTKPMAPPIAAHPVKLCVFTLFPQMPRVEYILNEKTILEATVAVGENNDSIVKIMENLKLAEIKPQQNTNKNTENKEN